MWGRQYPDTGIHANAEDESHSFSYLVDSVFTDQRVFEVPARPCSRDIHLQEDHSTDGYRRWEKSRIPVSPRLRGIEWS